VPTPVIRQSSLVLPTRAQPKRVPGGPSFVQTKQVELSAPAPSITVSFEKPVTPGNFIAISFVHQNGGSATSVVNDKGDTYTDWGGGLITDGAAAMTAGAFLVTTPGAISVTVTLSPDMFSDMSIREVAGLTNPVFDRVLGAVNSGAILHSSGFTSPLISASEVAIAHAAGQTAVTSLNPPFLPDVGSPRPGLGSAAAHLVPQSAAPLEYSVNCTGTNTLAMIIATLRSS